VNERCGLVVVCMHVSVSHHLRADTRELSALMLALARVNEPFWSAIYTRRWSSRELSLSRSLSQSALSTSLVGSTPAPFP
jgi:hypothetical protein